MKTMTIKYNPSNALAVALVEVIRKSKAIKVVSDNNEKYVPNKETLEAIEEIKKGGLKTYDSVEDMFHDIFD